MHFLSHTGQDRWVAEVFNYKKSGYFLDFGGFEGLLHDNTFYLEKFLNWRGILVEPNPVPYSSACAVRSCITVNAALWYESRKSLEFTDSHGLSSFVEFIESDSNSSLRKNISKRIFNVDTINPSELLDRFRAPEFIEYMSLDVEGAEFEVLKAFDFTRFKVALLSVEHNHEKEKREAIRSHLSAYDYSVIDHYNDDLFYNMDYINKIAGDCFTDPVLAQKKVLLHHKFLEY